MNDNLNRFLEKFQINNDGTKESIDKLQREIDFELPLDYLQFMNHTNGGEGEIGENSWLLLYRANELVEVNKDYKVLMDQIPDYFLIGKDAADTGYAVHKKNSKFHAFGLMSDFDKDSIENCGNSFLDFLKYLFEK